MLIERIREGVYVTSPEGEILDVNPAFVDLVGLTSRAEISSLRVADVLHAPAEREAELRLLEKDGSVRDWELTIRRRDGTTRTVLGSAFVAAEGTGRRIYVGILVDITGRKLLEDRLLVQAVRDPLTGCFNRHHLAAVSKKAEATGDCWGCLIFDLDFFKKLNDTRGHAEGDRALVAFSRFLALPRERPDLPDWGRRVPRLPRGRRRGGDARGFRPDRPSRPRGAGPPVHRGLGFSRGRRGRGEDRRTRRPDASRPKGRHAALFRGVPPRGWVTRRDELVRPVRRRGRDAPEEPRPPLRWRVPSTGRSLRGGSRPGRASRTAAPLRAPRRSPATTRSCSPASA